MSNVFPTDHHAAPYQSGLDEGIDNVDGSKDAGTGIGDIKDEGIDKAKMGFKLHGRTRLK